jgi:hypothetical protein
MELPPRVHLGLKLAGPFCAAIYFCSSSPETHCVKQHQRPLLAKNGNGREMSEQFSLYFATSMVNYRVLLHAVNL